MAKITPHQREVFDRLNRLTKHFQSKNGFVHERYIGSHGALWHLIRKGLVEPREVIGPRGGVSYEYRPIER